MVLKTLRLLGLIPTWRFACLCLLFLWCRDNSAQMTSAEQLFTCVCMVSKQTELMMIIETGKKSSCVFVEVNQFSSYSARFVFLYSLNYCRKNVFLHNKWSKLAFLLKIHKTWSKHAQPQYEWWALTCDLKGAVPKCHSLIPLNYPPSIFISKLSIRWNSLACLQCLVL